METLNDTDLDWLTSVETRLIRIRKREAANAARLDPEIEDVIKALDRLRCLLAGRLDRKVQTLPD